MQEKRKKGGSHGPLQKFDGDDEGRNQLSKDRKSTDWDRVFLQACSSSDWWLWINFKIKSKTSV
jgi:hypothetical protein